MLTLRGMHGDSLVVAPEFGGSVIGWTDEQGHMLFRHAVPEAVVAGDSHAMGCFPLVPYCNRIADGRFTWDGRTHQLDRNFGDHPHVIHGLGWQRTWSLEAVTSGSARMSLTHTAQGETDRAWPFPFEAVLTYALEDNGLVVTLSATNRHASPAPMGIGLHPWFPSRPGAKLQFAATGVWINGPGTLPRQHETVPPAWDHAHGLTIGSLPLDNCFSGWSSPARLQAGPGSLVIEADALFRNLQVFTPVGAGFYCIEPVSHMPDAINRPKLPPDQAMNVLAPGATLTGCIQLSRLGANDPLSKPRR